MSTARFTPALFAFLRELRENNDRAWFQDNRQRYERDVKEPALAFVLEFGPKLAAISPHFRADPRANGGALFRIHRDIRFSKDQSPFKTHTGLHFPHAQGRDAHTPGFYLHLEPRACFVGVGMWHPDNAALKLVRDAMVADPAAWRRAVADRAFARSFRVAGESLKRVPRGYPADHPLAESLKLKDITAYAPLTQSRITAPGFLDDFAGLCREGSSLVRYICGALGRPY